MSRSDNIPARRPPAPRIRTAPIRLRESNCAAAARSAVGSMQTISPPKLSFLAAKIFLTFMAASLSPAAETRSPGSVRTILLTAGSVKDKGVTEVIPDDMPDA